MYAIGKGVPTDLVSAYMWCSLAAAAGQKQWGCKEMLLEIAPKLKPLEMAEAKQRAYAWFEQRSKDPKQKHWAVGPFTLWGIDTDEVRLTAGLGLMYVEGVGVPKDDAEAVKWYHLDAERGDAPAESYMGERYYLGKGVPKDYDQAVDLFKRSAEQDWSPGQHNLASCYHQGIGVAKNEAEALKWFRKAAQQGNGESLHDLGAAYLMGWGVPKDEAAGYTWLRIAQAAGVEDPNVYQVAANLSEKQLKDADLKVAEWFKSHDADPKFQVALAHMYYRGEGVAKDPAVASDWARRAAKSENDRAQFLLGLMHGYGTGVVKDDAEAVKWYLKAAEQSHPMALNNLGWLYATSVEPNIRNPQKALEYALKAVAATKEKSQNF